MLHNFTYLLKLINSSNIIHNILIFQKIIRKKAYWILPLIKLSKKNIIGPSEIYFYNGIHSYKKYHWASWKTMLDQVPFCPFWKKDNLCLWHPKKLEEMFFDTMLFRRSMHFSEQLFSVWAPSHTPCFNIDSCHHSQKSVFSRKCHIAVLMFIFICTHRAILVC